MGTEGTKAGKATQEGQGLPGLALKLFTQIPACLSLPSSGPSGAQLRPLGQSAGAEPPLLGSLKTVEVFCFYNKLFLFK